MNFRMPDTIHVPALKACVLECGILKSIDERRNRKHPRVQTRHCREEVYSYKYEYTLEPQSVTECLQNKTNANAEIRDFSRALFVMTSHGNFFILTYCKALIL